MYLIVVFWVFLAHYGDTVELLEVTSLPTDTTDHNLTGCTNSSMTDCSTTEISLTNTTKIENASTAVSTVLSVTTILPVTTEVIATTNVSIELPEIEKKSNFYYKFETYCPCDLTVSHCNINCCCDVDCQDKHFNLFSKCLTFPKIHTTRYCYDQDLVWRNHTAYQPIIGPNGMFCIVKDNLPEKLFAIDKRIISTTETVKELISSKYIWPQNNKRNTENFQKDKYISDSFILVIKKGSFTQFEIPSNLVTDSCIRTTRIQFLKNAKSLCRISKKEPSNISNLYEKYIQDIKIVSSPNLLNASWFANISKECPKNVCLSISTYICNDFLVNCFNYNNFQRSTHETKNSSKLSLNYISHLKYVFNYNSSVGITTVKAYLSIRKFRLNKHESYQQEFSVSFQEDGVGENISLHRSGNPGYIHGNPILLAVTKLYPADSNVTLDGSIAEQLDINDTAVDKNFMIFPSNIDGICELNDYFHNVVKFGVNTNDVCYLRIDVRKENSSIICDKIQEKIWILWSLNNITSRNTILQRYIGMYGNANRSNFREWTPIITDEELRSENVESVWDSDIGTVRCKDLKTSLRVDILYTNVNYKDFTNRRKIVAINYNLYKQEIKLHNKINDIKLVVKIAFLDVTNNKYSHIDFASAPPFEFRLPNDFFYPFLLNSVPNMKPLQISYWLSYILYQYVYYM